MSTYLNRIKSYNGYEKNIAISCHIAEELAMAGFSYLHTKSCHIQCCYCKREINIITNTLKDNPDIINVNLLKKHFCNLILQDPTKFRMYKFENRLETFKDKELNPAFSGVDFAMNGFYYTGRKKQVQCFCCGFVVNQKKLYCFENIKIYHINRQKYCKFLFTILNLCYVYPQCSIEDIVYYQPSFIVLRSLKIPNIIKKKMIKIVLDTYNGTCHNIPNIYIYNAFKLLHDNKHFKIIYHLSKYVKQIYITNKFRYLNKDIDKCYRCKKPAQILNIPCGHHIYCILCLLQKGCTKRLVCPKCRTNIKQFVPLVEYR